MEKRHIETSETGTLPEDKSKSDLELTDTKSKVKKNQIITFNSVWQRLADETTKKDKPVVSKSETRLDEAEKLEATEMGKLSDIERRQVTGQLLRLRHQEISQELVELNEDVSKWEEIQAALAADAYLTAIEERMKIGGDLDIDNLTASAYEDVLLAYRPEVVASFEDGDDQSRPALGENVNNIQSDTDQNLSDDYLADAIPPHNIDRSKTAENNSFESPEQSYDRLSAPTILDSEATESSYQATTTDYNEIAQRQAAARGLLVGGIIGYLIGRRRGRLKTEKRLVPVQRKLEQEVKSLNDRLFDKELLLRKSINQRIDKANLTKNSSAMPQEVGVGNQPSFSKLNSIETSPDSSHDLDRRSSTATLSKAELLKISQKIKVGPVSLRQVYENNLISERGLRRSVGEHLKGGDVRRIVVEELLIKEIGYELDPQLRDRPLKTSQPSAMNVGADQSQLTKLVSTSGVSDDHFKAKFEVEDQLLNQSKRRFSHPILVTANITALIILVILVIILLITRI